MKKVLTVLLFIGVLAIGLGIGSGVTYLYSNHTKEEVFPTVEQQEIEETVYLDSSSVCNVKSFGAKGDGKSDDTESIQKAIDQNEYQILYFPSGDYQVEDLTIPENSATKQLIGENKESCTITSSGKVIVYGDSKFENLAIKSSKKQNKDTESELVHIGYDKNKPTVEFQNCRLLFENKINNGLCISIGGCTKLTVEKCEFEVGGIQIVNCDYFDINSNSMDGFYVNDVELLHIISAKGGTVHNNIMKNTNCEFVDFYPNATNITIENNRMDGSNLMFMEIKAIFRDDGAKENTSTTAGVWKNCIIRNNYFGGLKRSIWGFNITVTDNRTEPVEDDLRYYPTGLLFDGNYIDYSTYDDKETQSNKYMKEQYRVFGIAGMENLTFSNNTIQFSEYSDQLDIAFYFYTPDEKKRSQVSKNVVIQNNTIIKKDKPVIISYVGKQDQLSIKDNIMQCYGQFVFRSMEGYTRKGIVLDGNRYDGVIDGKKARNNRAGITMEGDIDDVTIKNQEIFFFNTAGTIKQLKVQDCDLKTLPVFSIDGKSSNIDELTFQKCTIPGGETELDLSCNQLNVINNHVKGDVAPFHSNQNTKINQYNVIGNYYDHTQLKSLFEPAQQ